MKTINSGLLGMALFAAVSATLFSSCKKDGSDSSLEENSTRWITLSAAIDDPENTTVGDGDAGTMVYSVSLADAKNPDVTINAFQNGIHVKSDRTARLQASADGKFLYNIQYTGDDGGIFNKYKVLGGKNFVPDGPEVETATYVSTSPRWLKAAEGVGVAVRATANPVLYGGTTPLFVFQKRTAKTDVLTLDLNNPQILKTTSFDLALTDQEVAAGYYVSRIDVPVVNKAGNKVYIGVAVSKHNTGSFTIDATGQPVFAADNSVKSWAKTLVLDYPSLANPKIITSDKTRGNTNGYRSTMQYVGTDGHVYQATSGELAGGGGSKILRINATTNDYDPNYVFSLDQALGITNSYIESWKYAGNGVGFVVYNIAGKGGYIAKVNLNDKTATKYTLPNETTLNFRQIQNIAIEGDELLIAVAPIGQDGNIYVFNRVTGEMTKGAKLVNEVGGQYIGAY
ncbi:hypothetical protein [Pedobacter sp. SYSU D00535]|uniref:hypothetical protein n=1 Tax=Pedobacter sp. SYSU D00535 TaxID=2810308 RepID=UPI001A95E581|nr:hypothetical protein [Pedobacter sp. SYSU D00535]